MTNIDQHFLLTIGIPTYNGAKFLNQTIDSITCQNLFQEGKVEILVSDNASTDDTFEIVQTYINQYPNLINYTKNQINLGYDKNVDNLFKYAKGKFVHILGDDDYLIDGAIDKIYRVCQNIDPLSVILLNSTFLDIDKNIEFAFNPMDRDAIFYNGDDFFQHTKWKTAAVSSLIINKEDWNKIDAAQYFGNQWIHISMLIEILAGKKTSYVIADKTIVIRRGNARWGSQNGNQLKLGLIHLQVLQNLNNFAYNNKTYITFYADRYKTNWIDILNLAPASFKQKTEIDRFMRSFFSKKAAYWLLHLPALYFVSTPYQAAKQIAKFLLNKVKGKPTK